MSPIAPRVPSVAHTAPDFTLPSSSNTPVTLSASRGSTNVLLAFFPAAFSSVCTAEMCALRDEFDQFAVRGVTVFGISVDSHHVVRGFKTMHGLQVELLSDFKREVSIQYGLLHVEETPAQRRENAEILAEIAKLS